MASTPLRAFIEQPAGYLGEKTDADTGWVFPVPNETYVHGHDAMMGHMVEAFRDGREPRETFHDGFVVNADPRCRVPLHAQRVLGARPRPPRRRSTPRDDDRRRRPSCAG